MSALDVAQDFGCDCCLTIPPVWQYRTEGFQWRDPDGKPNGERSLKDRWLVCEECAAMIEADDWDGFWDRAREGMRPMLDGVVAKREGQGPRGRLYAIAVRGLRSAMREFWRTRLAREAIPLVQVGTLDGEYRT